MSGTVFPTSFTGINDPDPSNSMVVLVMSGYEWPHLLDVAHECIV